MNMNMNMKMGANLNAKGKKLEKIRSQEHKNMDLYVRNYKGDHIKTESDGGRESGNTDKIIENNNYFSNNKKIGGVLKNSNKRDKKMMISTSRTKLGKAKKSNHHNLDNNSQNYNRVGVMRTSNYDFGE